MAHNKATWKNTKASVNVLNFGHYSVMFKHIKVRHCKIRYNIIQRELICVVIYIKKEIPFQVTETVRMLSVNENKHYPIQKATWSLCNYHLFVLFALISYSFRSSFGFIQLQTYSAQRLELHTRSKWLMAHPCTRGGCGVTKPMYSCHYMKMRAFSMHFGCVRRLISNQTRAHQWRKKNRPPGAPSIAFQSLSAVHLQYTARRI